MFHFVALMLLFFLSCAPSFCISLCVCVSVLTSSWHESKVDLIRHSWEHSEEQRHIQMVTVATPTKSHYPCCWVRLWLLFSADEQIVAFKATALMLCCRYFFGASCFVKCCPNRIKTFHCASLLLLVWFLNSIFLSSPFESRENVLSRLDTMLCALLGFHFPPSAITMVSWNNRNSFYCVATANFNTNTKSSTLSWLFMKVFCYSIRSVSIQEPTSCAHIFRFARIW